MCSKINPTKLFLFAIILIPAAAFSKVRLPKLISDGMVLQRNADIKVWGWGEPGEKISIEFCNSIYHVATNKNRKWGVSISDLKAGGPYTMTISGSNTIILNNILVGDVWVSSGQSNMEHTMYSFRERYQSEIDQAHNDRIRYFDVPQDYTFVRPQDSLASGHWVDTNPQTVGNFSAVAYFFAKYIYQKYKVPIGIINASVGGSPAEAWISEDALKEEFPTYYKEARRFKDSLLVNEVERNDQRRMQAWYNQLQEKDRGYRNLQKPWYAPEISTDDWSTMRIPGYWADTDLGNVNGVVWFRKKIDVPSSMTEKPALIRLGRIVDADSVFINGTFIGSTSYQYPRRRYQIPAGILKKGKNIIAIRVINVSGHGGFVPDKPYYVSAGQTQINLKGKWKYRLGTTMKPLEPQTFVRWKSTGLYNAMIAPLFNYCIKGVIWYQGESNANRPVEYRKLFTTLIRDWRKKWGEGNFAFLFVQLPNFMKAKKQPSQSDWARLREAQLKTLALPNTGMAVTVDIGEWNDIHPMDKKDVGERLALASEKVAYGEDNIVYSGPIYRSMKIKENKVILHFSHTGSGLLAKGNDGLKEFAIAGPDHHFVWANAKIDGDRVVVWRGKIANPVAVRYAWADNPGQANLYNREGLPASPFRTDDWDTHQSSD